jgi:hypothetical protein
MHRLRWDNIARAAAVLAVVALVVAWSHLKGASPSLPPAAATPVSVEDPPPAPAPKPRAPEPKRRRVKHRPARRRPPRRAVRSDRAPAPPQLRVVAARPTPPTPPSSSAPAPAPSASDLAAREFAVP